MTIRFNSRAHGGRDKFAMQGFTSAIVSIHAPTGGATPVACTLPKPSAFQFTRPRGARHNTLTGEHIKGAVSIHAPTGGATIYVATSRGVVQFQFTRPRGARHNGQAKLSSCCSVSIHAPTGGATIHGRGKHGRDHVSIHAPTGGATGVASKSIFTITFQFTRPRGARL